jgi:hypothetical protein
VTVCDSVYIGSKWRKRMTLSRPSFNNLTIKWVEGIGDIINGFNLNYSNVEYITGTLGGYYQLRCFSEHFQTVYGWGCVISQFCGSSNPTSSIKCNTDSSQIKFELNAVVPPLTFTIQPPAACSPSYTATASTLKPAFDLNCVGVYTFTAKDANNRNIGVITHTVTSDSTMTVLISATQNTICIGDTVNLNTIASTSVYTLNPILWSTGGSGPSVIISPTITSTYSLSALSTAISTRTCHATGSKKIVVDACTGIKESKNYSLDIFAYPNPAKEYLFIGSSSIVEIVKYKLSSIEGKTVAEGQNNNVDVSFLTEGLYFLHVNTKFGTSIKKIIVKRD